jgi:ribosomal protein L32
MSTDVWAGNPSLPVFTGYPYMVTRIGESALRHIAIAPVGWPYDRLVDLLARQAATNQLPTCLVLGPNDAVYVDVDRDRDKTGTPTASTIVPSGLTVINRIQLPTDVPETPEMADRRGGLVAYAGRLNRPGYIVGDNLEGGRAASPEDIARLTGRAIGDPGPGLDVCPTCGELAGDFLRTYDPGIRFSGPRILRVDCRCANHNHCARCGETLAAHRLSAYYWDSRSRGISYVAAYAAFGHRCPGLESEPNGRPDLARANA